MKNHIRIVADIHGKYDAFDEVVKDCIHWVQLGDFGFSYSSLNKYDKNKCRVVRGNHCNYDIAFDHDLGDFGSYTLNGIKFFFVRGAMSIDCLSRVQNYINHGVKSWWYEEELGLNRLCEAVDLYEEVKPDVVLTHDAPVSVKNIISNPAIMLRFGWNPKHNCRTQLALETMRQLHQPRLWCFGHYHKDWNGIVEGTHFFCRKELSYLDLTKVDDSYLVELSDGEKIEIL